MYINKSTYSMISSECVHILDCALIVNLFYDNDSCYDIIDFPLMNLVAY